jgi:hypothetical protein
MRSPKNYFFNAIVIALTFIALSCSYQEGSVNEIERKDNEFCISKGLDFIDFADPRTEIYWRCRLFLAKNKIAVAALAIQTNTHYNPMIRNMILSIEENIKKSHISWNEKLSDWQDNLDHNYCINKGYNVDTTDLSQIEDYFLCRKELIDITNNVPPFGNQSYLNLQNQGLSLDFAINKRIDLMIEEEEEMKKKYPKCIAKMRLKSGEIEVCKKKYDEVEMCLKEVEKKCVKKDFEEKNLCQKKAYIIYPDSMIKDQNKRMDEIEKKKLAADVYNQNSFSAIGIDERSLEKFMSKDDKKNDKKKKRNVSSEGLYSKLEISLLRKKYATFCQKSGGGKMENYANALKKECRSSVAEYE